MPSVVVAAEPVSTPPPAAPQSYEQIVPGLTKNYFDGEVPSLEISGPGIARQPIPATWLYQ
jgi:hypothetical protein